MNIHDLRRALPYIAKDACNISINNTGVITFTTAETPRPLWTETGVWLAPSPDGKNYRVFSVSYNRIDHYIRFKKGAA